MALTTLFLKPFKVSRDAFQYLVGLAFSELGNQPFVWLVVVFGVVAAILPLAKRDHIFGDSTWAIQRRQWNPMIHRQSMPQAGRSTANSAAATEVVEGALPIGGCESIGEVPFSCPSTLSYRINLLRISPFPASCPFLCFFRIFLLPFAAFVRIALDPISRYLTSSFWISLCPILSADTFLFFMLISIGSFLCGYFFSVRLSVFAKDSFMAFNVLNIVIAATFFNARLAGSSKRILGPIEVFHRGWFFDTADAANTGIHSVSLSLSHMMASADGVSAVVSGSYSLADKPIIPHGAIKLTF